VPVTGVAHGEGQLVRVARAAGGDAPRSGLHEMSLSVSARLRRSWCCGRAAATAENPLLPRPLRRRTRQRDHGAARYPGHGRRVERGVLARPRRAPQQTGHPADVNQRPVARHGARPCRSRQPRCPLRPGHRGAAGGSYPHSGAAGPCGAGRRALCRAAGACRTGATGVWDRLRPITRRSQGRGCRAGACVPTCAASRPAGAPWPHGWAWWGAAAGAARRSPR
jgi:hypothetical protein